MKRFLGILLSLVMLLAALPVRADAVSRASSAAIVSAALSQIDYEETATSYSKYGAWYGVPNGHWCDMFVSWCAGQAGLSTSIFPRSASCTAHVRNFRQLGCYHVSAARCGDYVPQQGDEIFFYDYTENPDGKLLQHTGIVLCVENGFVFTVEGNTLTNRLDYAYYESVAPLRDDELESLDYVAVKHYPLDAPQIHGYASPRYQNREPLAHDGFVDLGCYEGLRGVFDTLAERGIMAGTSSYTFSPRYGMTRGEFLASVMHLFGFSGWADDTQPFDDVPEGNPYYEAVMAARSAGIICGSGDNLFEPELYISAASAQAILSRTLTYLGLEDRTFSFTEGDFSYLLTPYTIRADLARALYELLPEADGLSKQTADGSEEIMMNEKECYS